MYSSLSVEYDGLTAVAGPACGAAFTDVASQSLKFRLPAIAYTPQAPPSASLALLTAGDARNYVSVYGSFLSQMQWHRIAVLSEPATRASLAVARLQADLVAHIELPNDGPDHNYTTFTKVRRLGSFTVYEKNS